MINTSLQFFKDKSFFNITRGYRYKLYPSSIDTITAKLELTGYII